MSTNYDKQKYLIYWILILSARKIIFMKIKSFFDP